MYCKLITLRTTLNANFPSSNSSTHDTPFSGVRWWNSSARMSWNTLATAMQAWSLALQLHQPTHTILVCFTAIYARGPATPPPPHGMDPIYWPHMRSSPSPPYGVVGVWHCPPPSPRGVVGVWYGMLGMYGVYGRSGMACLESMVCLVGMVCMAWMVGVVWIVGMVCLIWQYVWSVWCVCLLWWVWNVSHVK